MDVEGIEEVEEGYYDGRMLPSKKRIHNSTIRKTGNKKKRKDEDLPNSSNQLDRDALMGMAYGEKKTERSKLSR